MGTCACHLRSLVGLEFPWHQYGRTSVGGPGPGQLLLFGLQPSTNLKSSYKQNLPFFFTPSNLKATLHSKDTSGISGMDFYVVQ